MLEQEKNSYLSVSALNNIIKSKLESDYDLKGIYVKGEISNWKVYRSGVFFDLKDENGSTLSCIIWSNNAERLDFTPKDGDEVLVYGNITVYAQRGRYSLQVFTIQLFGKGSSLLALEALKRKLAKEGLFDLSRKRAIPKMPNNIGIIVGKDSAAESDLRRNILRRWPIANLYIFYAQVQGKESPASIKKALAESEQYPLDVLIVARGGGSNEDLSSFNDESLVRAFAAAKVPFISAVGHEIDVTLIDYVADLRVSTPTGAAEAATPNQDDIRYLLANYENSLNENMLDKINFYKEKVASLSRRSFFLNPKSIYGNCKEKLANKEDELIKSIKQKISNYRNSIETYSERLKAMNPDNVVKRGYSMTLDENGVPIISKKSVKEGQVLKTKVKDGIITSRVIEGE